MLNPDHLKTRSLWLYRSAGTSASHPLQRARRSHIIPFIKNTCSSLSEKSPGKQITVVTQHFSPLQNKKWSESGYNMGPLIHRGQLHVFAVGITVGGFVPDLSAACSGGLNFSQGASVKKRLLLCVYHYFQVRCLILHWLLFQGKSRLSDVFSLILKNLYTKKKKMETLTFISEWTLNVLRQTWRVDGAAAASS